jgi:hypothetical protein
MKVLRLRYNEISSVRTFMALLELIVGKPTAPVGCVEHIILEDNPLSKFTLLKYAVRTEFPHLKYFNGVASDPSATPLPPAIPPPPDSCHLSNTSDSEPPGNTGFSGSSSSSSSGSGSDADTTTTAAGDGSKKQCTSSDRAIEEGMRRLMETMALENDGRGGLRIPWPPPDRAIQREDNSEETDFEVAGGNNGAGMGIFRGGAEKKERERDKDKDKEKEKEKEKDSSKSTACGSASSSTDWVSEGQARTSSKKWKEVNALSNQDPSLVVKKISAAAVERKAKIAGLNMAWQLNLLAIIRKTSENLNKFNNWNGW